MTTYNLTNETILCQVVTVVAEVVNV